MNRNLLLTLLVAGTAVIAGCTTNTGNDATPTPGSDVDTPPAASDALKQQVLVLYTSKPFTTTNDVSTSNTPAHTWLKLDENHMQFLHWDNDDPMKATGLLFTGDGFRGRFCAGDAGVTKAEYDAGFVHFHTGTAPNWDAGHNAGGANGAPSTEGWWLRHIGAADMTMTMMGMEMTVEKGKVFPLMPAGFEALEPCT